MKTEKITRSEATKTRASNYMVVLTADEGKKLITQNWLDYKNGTWEEDDIPDVGVCTKIYLGVDDSALNYVEVDEDTANTYQEEYDKLMKGKNNTELGNKELSAEELNTEESN
jgi:hypothetical protein